MRSFGNFIQYVSGLDSQEAFRRLQAFGKNQLEEEDEASLTGESIPSGKDSSTIFPATTAPYDLINMVFAGTSIVRKMGKAIAVYTGRKTYFQG